MAKSPKRRRLLAPKRQLTNAEADKESAEGRAFFDDARSRLVPGMVMIGGPGLEVYDDRTSLVGFLFAIDHIPLPLEEILEWLRDHPLVRVIEVDRSGIANGPPNER